MILSLLHSLHISPLPSQSQSVEQFVFHWVLPATVAELFDTYVLHLEQVCVLLKSGIPHRASHFLTQRQSEQVVKGHLLI